MYTVNIDYWEPELLDYALELGGVKAYNLDDCNLPVIIVSCARLHTFSCPSEHLRMEAYTTSFFNDFVEQ